MAENDFTWTLKSMRMGYAGRGLTYVVVAGVSLWAIWRGGEAEGTSSALKTIEGAVWGQALLVATGIGLLAYALWRVICALYDLEDYGTDGEGMIARGGQVTTGLIHGVLGAVALGLIGGGGGGSEGGEGSGVTKIASAVMDMPGGRWIVLIAGLVTIGAGLYYANKAWKEKYREHLIGNEVTANWNWILKAGVLAQAVVITIIGGFLTYAGWTYDPSQASGLGGVWEFLQGQPFGNILVILLCLGLLCFAVFCFVNAAYRVVPNAREEKVTTLATRMKSKSPA